MPNILPVLHITFPLVLSFLYIYFILYLIDPLIIYLPIIFVFSIIFFAYALACYNIFHSRPGYITYSNTVNQLGIDQICQFKKNQERKKQLLAIIEKNIRHEEIQKLIKEGNKNVVSQYANLYLEYSFCNTCEIVKIPRSYHCQICNRCILRREKHSDLIGNCLGQENIKFYMQYVLMAQFLSIYMILTLLVAVIIGREMLNNFSSTVLVVFAVVEMILGTSVALFMKQVCITYANIRDNITQTQRKTDILNPQNNPFRSEDYYHTLFKSFLDFIKVTKGPNPAAWMELTQQHNENLS